MISGVPMLAGTHRLRPRSRSLLAVVALVAMIATPMSGIGSVPADAAGASASAGGFLFYKFPLPQPACSGVGIANALFTRTECGFSVFQSDADPAADLAVDLFGPGQDTAFTQVDATYDAIDLEWQFNIQPGLDWPAGEIRARVMLDGEDIGGGAFFVNVLDATVDVADAADPYRPGDEVDVAITVERLQGVATQQVREGVPAEFTINVVRSDNSQVGPYGPFTAAADGTFAWTMPSEATAGLTSDIESNFRSIVSVEVVDASWTDVATGEWYAEQAGVGPVSVLSDPPGLVLKNQFISSTGWVKNGESYPFRVTVENYLPTAFSDLTVTIPPVDGTTFTNVKPLASAGTASVAGDGSITWTADSIPAGAIDQPARLQLIVEGVARSAAQDPQIVWKNLSATATLTYAGGTGQSARSLGPHVIPDALTFDTARYGERPFPVVPVDWRDRKHEPSNTGDRINAIINSPDIPGSTTNLWQEMSMGMLRPIGDLPSSGIATAGWDVEWKSQRHQDGGWSFTEMSPQGTCMGVTSNEFVDTPLLPERINNGWYQMPGDTGYYGTDRYSAGSLAGAIAGVGAIFAIDDACGPTGKAVYDAAHIADPEIDYNEFDTDKDGVVDFFMMLYVGLGGHGDSQINGTPPYDNIWPHSSSLEFYYSDPDTGLNGYITDDRLTDLEGNELFYADDSYTGFTTQDTGLPAYVRVGPYNVNPESSIGKASVISHEYGHSLGLPDFYSQGSRATYGSWNLMASDYSQHMDIFGKVEMGWVVPQPLTEDVTVTDWEDDKVDTHRIEWQTPDGTPYVLEGPDVHNAEAYTAKLPPKLLIDPALVENGASSPWLYFSGSGNDFGCSPTGGHNLDIYLPELEQVAEGSTVTLAYKTWFDIEWDYDYGFVLISDDEGTSYQGVQSQQGYSTPSSQNPNQNGCLNNYDWGLTGTSGSYQAATAEADRILGEYPEGDSFVDDSYDISALAGTKGVVRFSYATDPGLARPGWFIDDVVVSVDGEPFYESDFSQTHEDGRIFPGGCGEEIRVAAACTVGWARISATEGSPADHAYYLAMRDRSSFDFKDGRGQSDRGDISWSPGLYMMYTNESRGYGNTGVDGAPAQSPLDSQPQ
ncbi:MAG TPA: immune inhibitor A domain-containing protein, partial [Nitriliruptorales bacterium]